MLYIHVQHRIIYIYNLIQCYFFVALMATTRPQFSAENSPETTIPPLLHTTRAIGEADLWLKKKILKSFSCLKTRLIIIQLLIITRLYKIYHYDTAAYNVLDYRCSTVKILKQIMKVYRYLE